MQPALPCEISNRRRMLAPQRTKLRFGLRRPRCCWAALLLVVLLTQPGCQIFSRFGGKVDNVPILYNQLPSQQDLLANMNARSARVSQLNSSVTVMMPGTPKISGTLQIEFPDRVRMKAGFAGMSEMGVDVGSNSENFWIWSKADLPGQPPAMYFARHDEFERSPVRQAIPLEPKSLIDALGLIEFRPSDVHHGPMLAAGGRMKLFTIRQTPAGPQTRVTLFSSTTGIIEQQAVYDAANQLIAYSNSSDYKNYPEHQISLPQRIELHMIQPDGQDVKIVADLGNFSIGTPTAKALYGDPDKMWTMPNPAGVPKIDLARVSPGNPPGTLQNNANDYPPKAPQYGFPSNSAYPRGSQRVRPGSIR